MQLYDKMLPEMGGVRITPDTAEKVAHHLTGGTGLDGTDAYSLQGWILQFGHVTKSLQKEVGQIIE